MAEIPCAWCGRTRTVSLDNLSHTYMQTRFSQDIVRGTLTCAFCQKHTLFEMTGNDATYLPGQLYQEDLEPNVPESAREAFEDALKAMLGSCYRGTVALCRSAIEEALDAQYVPGNNLFEKASKAKGTILRDIEFSHADGARVLGRDALHKGKPVSMSEAELAIIITVQLLNHIAERPPYPASQSGPTSN